jgi:hypothetical protein
VQVAIKTARELALLPYTQRTASERGPGRGPGRGGGGRRDEAREDGDEVLQGVEGLDLEDLADDEDNDEDEETAATDGEAEDVVGVEGG